MDATSATVKVTGLDALTHEEQIYEVFCKCGDIKRIVMCISPSTRKPVGSCFVVFYTQADAGDSVSYLHGTTIDGKTLRVTMDPGYTVGREFEDSNERATMVPGTGYTGYPCHIEAAGLVPGKRATDSNGKCACDDGREKAAAASVHVGSRSKRSKTAIVWQKPDNLSLKTETEEAWKDPRNNPHVAQVYLNKGAGYKAHTDIPFQRTLTDDFPRQQYRRRQNEQKTVIHWGQRKLLMSEIEFLTMYGKPGHPVVYAGAAPGTHIKHLAQLFPELDFVLVDPAPFNLTETAQVTLRQELFTDAVAAEFTGRAPLFISDIRAADWQEMGEEENEKQVQDDMAAQWRWHEIMQPLKSMLKFRLSWRSGTTRYLSGTVYLPVWGPITTTEARLVPDDGGATREYDNTAYEQQMFHFNTSTRVGLYPHGGAGVGLCHCYDCTAEVAILSAYLSSRGRLPHNPDVLAKAISQLSSEASAACAVRRTLADPNSDPEARKRGIRQRQWIDGMPAYAAARQRDQGQSSSSSDASARYGPGARLLAGMGYQPGAGLGPSGTGMREPLAPRAPQQPNVRRGLGFSMCNRLTPREAAAEREGQGAESGGTAGSAGVPGSGQSEVAATAIGCGPDDDGGPSRSEKPAAERFELVLTNNPAQPHVYREVATGRDSKRPPAVAGWEVRKRSSCDAYYYYHPATRATQYEVPQDEPTQ